MSKVSYFNVLRKTFKRDMKGLSALIRTQRAVNKEQKRNASVPLIFSEVSSKNPSKMMLLSESKNYTYQEVDIYSNQIASFFKHNGLKKGDDVALFMTSSPEYIAVWLGLSKIGVVSALVNNNLKLDTLAHSITAVNSKAVIFDFEHRHAIAEVMPLLKNHKLKYFMIGGGGDAPEGTIDIERDLSSEPKKFDMIQTNFSDKLFYIYTSGTTGIPKAVIIKHSRFIFVGLGGSYVMSNTDDDIFYTPLPLHHSAAGIIGATQAVLKGNTMAIRAKASVSSYFEDCKKYNATVAQYIGELCRYLYAQPEKPSDTDHKLRLMIGNGIRPNLWEPFQKRFKIPQIVELYGSTEGNATIFNLDNHPGACGFITMTLPKVVMRKLYPVALVKCDPETGEPVRDKNGLCIRCEAGEVGQFVGKIDQNNPIRSFDGYSNTEATKKRIITDVFSKGEMAYASGDLLFLDDYGYLYFHDRTGDTFRWKGENVSTTEVETVLMKESDLNCVVYGVTVPNCEGRAGMATIQDPTKSLDVNHLLPKIQKILPDYALPLFLRITDELDQTSTFKLTKTQLRKEAFDPKVVKDPLYYYDKKIKTYKQFTDDTLDDITSGKIVF